MYHVHLNDLLDGNESILMQQTEAAGWHLETISSREPV
jgi:hypothetical protein